MDVQELAMLKKEYQSKINNLLEEFSNKCANAVIISGVRDESIIVQNIDGRTSFKPNIILEISLCDLHT